VDEAMADRGIEKVDDEWKRVSKDEVMRERAITMLYSRDNIQKSRG